MSRDAHLGYAFNWSSSYRGILSVSFIAMGFTGSGSRRVPCQIFSFARRISKQQNMPSGLGSPGRWVGLELMVKAHPPRVSTRLSYLLADIHGRPLILVEMILFVGSVTKNINKAFVDMFRLRELTSCCQTTVSQNEQLHKWMTTELTSDATCGQRRGLRDRGAVRNTACKCNNHQLCSISATINLNNNKKARRLCSFCLKQTTTEGNLVNLSLT